MAYPTPTAGQFNSPVFQTFLANHPTLAGLRTAADVTKFLDAHPDIARAYTRILAPRPAAPTPSTPSGGTTVGPTGSGASTATQSARALIEASLASRGLTGIGEAAWNRYLELGGDSNPNAVDVIYQELRSGAAWTKGAYANRYPGMAELDKNGQSMTEAQYRNLEDQYRDRAHRYGLPASFYDDPTDFGKLIAGNVAPDEYEDRLKIAARYSATDPEAARLRDEYARLYGPQLGNGAAIAYMIDPNRALDAIETQHRAATAAAASATTGFGELTKAQAENVAGMGLSEDTVQQGFAQIAGLDQLETGLVGDAGSSGVSRDDMISAAFTGNADARKRVAAEQRRRTAQFEGGGGFAASQGGVTGLGSAGA